MQESVTNPGLECWRHAGVGALSWHAALKQSAQMLGAQAIAFGAVGGAGGTRLIGVYPSNEAAIAQSFTGDRQFDAESGHLRSEVATATLYDECVTIWVVALLEREETSHLLRDIAQAAAQATVRAARLAAPSGDLSENEMRLARDVLHDSAQHTLH